MAHPRPLARPPITEALVDFRATLPGDEQTFRSIAERFASRFPKREPTHGIHAELRIENGQLVPPRATVLGFQGMRLTSADDTTIIQFGPNGFTFNNLKVYIGGDALLGNALDAWSELLGALGKDVSVTRVALRYLNRLVLPFRTGDEFKVFLAAVPELPEGSPQAVSGFLGRVVARDTVTDSYAIVTQRLELESFEGEVKPVVLIDVDVFREGQFNGASLQPTLDQLRVLKNNIFFSLLQEAAVRLYE
jgi:uncharacterized protein (TIGR04255 family)